MELAESISYILEKQILHISGKWGPVWLVLYGLYVLSNNMFVSLIFIASVTVNDILNRVLKEWIKEERPDKWTTDRKHFLYYGMPSGHAQHSAFIATFIYLLAKRAANMYFVLALTSIVFFERIYNRQHTFKQVAAGALIGVIFSYSVYYFLTHCNRKINI